MAADTAIELKKRGVASISLWPGAVQTELVSQYVSEGETPPGFDPKVSHLCLLHTNAPVISSYQINK